MRVRGGGTEETWISVRRLGVDAGEWTTEVKEASRRPDTNEGRLQREPLPRAIKKRHLPIWPPDRPRISIPGGSAAVCSVVAGVSTRAGQSLAFPPPNRVTTYHNLPLSVMQQHLKRSMNELSYLMFYLTVSQNHKRHVNLFF